MKHGKILLVASLLFSLNAEAALYNRGNGLVYDSDLNVTWSKDVQLFRTMANNSGNAEAFIDAVINANNGVIHETPWVDDVSGLTIYDGNYQLAQGDFTVTGFLNWRGAQAFVGYLNQTHYQGFTDWRLPNVNPVNGVNFNHNLSFDGSTDHGWGIISKNSELAYLFNVELQGSEAGVFQDSANGNVADNFLNVSTSWSGTEYGVTDPINNPWLYSDAFLLNTANGGAQAISDKNQKMYAWILRTGDVTAVPVPAAAWLFGSTILGFAGLKRRKS